MPKGRIVVDEEGCKGCGLCATACPHQLIRLDDTRLNTRGYHPAELVDADGQCSGCALCAVICPDACLTVYRQVTGPARARAATRVPA
jgi:2-oxoglutarate ferredoxin oxidoreductase subunit delta